MASWHQSRRPVKRYHETLWTVWDDPYGQPAGAYLFKTEKEANEMVEKLRQHGRTHGVYVVPPKTR